ncbi:MAG TPA: RagB/SusD family nutrient uptake outer membrane protein [Chitinophaga sp.]|uniref:RagB/SusD family nutrient uptake outer membrane protein n=1 Tax=Chitinophaga sp. TaxID=1869181 RepID=UPI002C020566|nr:RagB/SusD family nutrient uptake outer membrane protein [Chitinophaga sp.]HVI48945.1 RagB/SusD family nutrient uptake outer membrane protein [Chitinophaga sp.]
MKNTKLFILLALGSVVSSCNKDFLQRNPQTEISPEAYFNTPKDLDTYINSLYDKQVTAPTNDESSDNISNYPGSTMELLVQKNITPATVGGWDNWSQLRSVNFMLDNVRKTQGDEALIKHYIGIARYFRARFYFSKIATYGDVPWYSTALSDVDQSMYKARDPRANVADSMLADLSYAAENIKADAGNGTRVNKYTALALMARFCLFEGTFRKYHPEAPQQNVDALLNKAVWACEQIMNSGKYRIYSTGKGGEDYRALFCGPTLAGNPEIIQWRDYPQSLGVGNDTHSVLGWTWSLSQSLVYSYLTKDGKPFSSVPNWDKLDFVATFKDRDPRLAETVSYPGFSTNQDANLYIPKPNLGGYDQLKFYPRDPKQRQGWGANYTGLPVYRYAEVLLTLAEAKAELGTITQTDLDNTVNQLRSRVQLPALAMGIAVDPFLDAQYKNINNPNKGVLLEIRRERRVELACEGLRLNDLNRWYAGSNLKAMPQGMYVPAFGGIDMSGDGNADIAILPNPSDTSSIAGLPADVRAKMSRFYLADKDGKENNFYLENGTSGHIMFTVNRNGREFIEPKYYYRPIPLQQTVLNPKLEQLYGWKQ